MDADSYDRLSMLMILHATCETALQRFAGGTEGDRQIAAKLKGVLEHTRAELDAVAAREAAATPFPAVEGRA